MKIPVTDQFLWLVYNFGSEISDLLYLGRPRGLRDFNPEKQKFWRNIQKKKDKKQFAQFINHLKVKGYIKESGLKAEKGILLTKKGEQKALGLNCKLIEKEKRKDGKWIMIMYDIPEKKRSLRVFLRRDLMSLGYKKFQNSIWVCPYDVYKETEKVIQGYLLTSYVKIFLIEEIKIK
ncbi:hypothetical protein KKA24_02555 [Patescibacteria group bacterium]|nr:hypothetical protein [Patescibacteria group bacterium]